MRPNWPSASPPALLEQAAGRHAVLNEIEDLAPSAQRLLLGRAGHGSFSAAAARTPVRFDARIICVGAAGLRDAAAAGRSATTCCRSCNVLTLRVPPLRDYAEDVPGAAALLRRPPGRCREAAVPPLRRRGAEPAAQLPLAGQHARAARTWCSACWSQGGTEEIRLEEIERETRRRRPADEPLVKQDLLALPLREAREHFERAYLTQQLLLCDGKVGQLAKRVGMERTHLYRKLRSLGVDFRQADD